MLYGLDEIGNDINDHELDYNQIMCSSSLNGQIDDKYYDNDEVFIVKDNTELIIVDRYSKETIIKLPVNKCKKLILGEGIILIYDEYIFTIFLDEYWRNTLGIDEIPTMVDSKIGLDGNNNLFFIKQDEKELRLERSNGVLFKAYKNRDIKDISIKSILESNEDYFLVVELTIGEIIEELLIAHFMVKNIIKDTYIYSMKPMLSKVNPKSLYSSWAKNTNDLLNYNLFEGMYSMKKFIDEKSEEGLNESNRIDIVNALYYYIQDQKKKYDVLSAYFPKMMETEEKKVFKSCSKNIDCRKFKILQKQLFGLTNQVSRNLADVERSLSQVTSVIFTDLTMRNTSTKMRNNQMKISIATSVGASMLMGGALALPFLATNIVGLYNNHKMEKKLEEVESKKLEIFSNQAIDKFEHLFYDMLPYYIGEANDILVEVLKVLGKEYEEVDENIAKEALFKRVADLYTFKQLPNHSGTTEKRKDIIKEIHKIPQEKYYNTDGNLMLT